MKTFLIERDGEILAIIRAENRQEVLDKIAKAMRFAKWDFRYNRDDLSGYYVGSERYDIKESSDKRTNNLNYLLGMVRETEVAEKVRKLCKSN